MSYRQQSTDASIADGFLKTPQNRRTAGLFNYVAGAANAVVNRIAEHHRRAVYRRETMNAMAKLNDRMLTDVGWPGRYDPENLNDPGNQ